MKWIKLLLARLALFGKVPLCNGIASRAMHLGDFCFPLCYRCMMFIICFLLTLKFGKKHQCPWIILFLCLLPMIIDGWMQTFYGIESYNLRRMLTGGLFGFAIGQMICQIEAR